MSTSTIARVAKHFVAASLAAVSFSAFAASDVYVSGTGNDADDGSALTPFRTLTAAFAALDDGGTVHVDEGVYGPVCNESFPISITGGASLVGWSQSNSAIDRTTRVITGDNIAVYIFDLSAGASLAISDCVLRDTANAAVNMVSASIAATNVLFTQSVESHAGGDFNNAAGFYVGSVRGYQSNTMVFQSCEFSGMKRDVMLENYSEVANANYTFKITMDDCVVADNTVKYGNICDTKGNIVVADFNRTVFRNNYITNTGTQHDAYGAAILWTRGNSNAKSKTNMKFDRCQFVDNSGRALFGVNNVNTFKVTNSLFVDNQITGYTFGGHSVAFQMNNCTAVGGVGGFIGRDSSSTVIRNSILLNVQNINFKCPNWNTYASKLTIYDSIIYNCTLGLGYSESSSGIVSADPLLENADTSSEDFDPRPRPYSPAIDAANDTYATGAFDLDGNARIADNNADGTPRADIGAFESLFAAAVEPTFSVPVDGHLNAFRGQQISVPVTIDAGDSIIAPVTATVSYPTGISGNSTLSFVNGESSATLTFIIDSDAPDGILRISIADSASPAAVLPANYDVTASDLTITTGGDSVFLKEGDEADIPVTLAIEGATTPTDITISAATVEGDGTSTATWIGGDTIAAGTNATAGALHIVAGAGVNTVTLTTTAGVFAETGTDSITIMITAHDGILRVDPVNGSDETGTGLAGETPLKTATHALAVLPEGTILLADGTYSAESNGETFPLVPHGVRIAGTSPEGTILDAANAADNIISIVNEATASVIENLAIRNSKDAPIHVFGSDLAITNCAFTQSQNSSSACGGILVREDSHVEIVDCVFTNMTRASAIALNQGSLTVGKGDRSVSVIGCRFEDLNSYYAAITTYYGSGNASWFALDLSDCTFIGNTTQDKANLHDSYSASCIWVELGDHGTKNTISVDRCRLFANAGNHVIAGDHTKWQVTSTIFADNAATVSNFKGYGLIPYFRNCTFIHNSKGMWTGENKNFTLYVNNSIFLDDGPLTVAGGAASAQLASCMLYGTSIGGGYSESAAGTVTTDVDPILENAGVAWDAEGFDPRPRPYSPAIDAASADSYLTDTDLFCNPRVADNNDDGIAAADLGACESLFHAALAPTPYLPLPGKASAYRGGAIEIPVSIEPPAGDYPVTLAVTYGVGATGVTELVFADAATTNVLAVEIADDAPDSARIAFADAASPAAVLPAVFDLVLGDLSLTVGGDTLIHVREGDTIELPVSMALEGSVAPADIAVTVGTLLGSGTSSVEWIGDAEIPAGGTTTEGGLSITGGAGVNTIAVNSEFAFKETGTRQVVLTIIAHPGYLYADSANGSDETGTGLADAPFATITHAITRLSNGDEVRILPGTYSEETGETFPLAPAGVALVGWSEGAAADPASVAIDGTNGVANVVAYGFGPYTGLVANVTLRETKEAAAFVENADAIFRNCVFTQSAASTANHRSAVGGGVQMKDASHVGIEGCVFDGITRMSAVHSMSATYADDGNTLRIVDSLFTNCVSSLGAVGIYQSRTALYMTNDTFVANSTPSYKDQGGNIDQNPGYVHDSLSAAAIYIYGNYNQGPREVLVDRCSFLGNAGNVLIGTEYVMSLFRISNSLFAGNQPIAGMISGYWTSMRIANCTFVGNAGSYTGRYATEIRNSIFYKDGQIAGKIPGAYHNDNGTITLDDDIVFDTSLGVEAQIAYGAEGVLAVDPLLRNADVAFDDPAFDAATKTASPARDRALPAYVYGDFDLAGNARTMFNGADLGCYENASTGGTLIMVK